MKALVKELYNWLDESLAAKEIVELSTGIRAQIEKLEETGNGVGLVIFQSHILIEQDGATTEINDNTVGLSVNSLPVVRMKGKWYIVTDENLSDVVSAIIRMLIQP